MDTTNETNPVEAALAVEAARDRLVDFVNGCSDDQWRRSPLGDDDPRAVGVIVDHVADAYGYLAGWVSAILAGDTVEVTGEIVDGLNAEHAVRAAGVTREDVRRHLIEGGDKFIALVRPLRPDQFTLDDGRIGRLVAIAARHADNHRAELESAAGRGSSPAG